MTNGLIITATDTDVGKTVFSAALVEALKAHYWKPIQAGLEDETDLETVKRLTNASQERLHPETYRLKTPCSPHFAAEIDGITIDPQKLLIPKFPNSENIPLIIEGAGGLLVPLTNTHLQIDQFKIWGQPIILCARTKLGTINHTLLSVEAIKNRGLPLLGIVFIGDTNTNTEQTIANFTGARILGTLPIQSPLNKDTLAKAFARHFHTGDFLQKP